MSASTPDAITAKRGFFASDGCLGAQLEIESPYILSRRLPRPWGFSYWNAFTHIVHSEAFTEISDEEAVLRLDWALARAHGGLLQQTMAKGIELEFDVFSQDFTQVTFYVATVGNLYLRNPVLNIPRRLITRELRAIYQLLPDAQPRLIQKAADA